MRALVQLLLKLIEPFTDDCGRLSSMRIMTVATVMACIYLFFEVISVWKIVCIAKQEFIPLNFTDFTGLLGAVAALFAKGWQKNIEAKSAGCSFQSPESLPLTYERPSPPIAPPKINGPRRRPEGVLTDGEGEQ